MPEQKKKPRRNLFIPPKYHYFKITPPPEIAKNNVIVDITYAFL